MGKRVNAQQYSTRITMLLQYQDNMRNKGGKCCFMCKLQSEVIQLLKREGKDAWLMTTWRNKKFAI